MVVLGVAETDTTVPSRWFFPEFFLAISLIFFVLMARADVIQVVISGILKGNVQVIVLGTGVRSCNLQGTVR